MATADARRAHAKWGVRCVFGDGKTAYWSEVFIGNPKIARREELKPNEQFAWVPNFPTNRPYIERLERGKFHYRKAFKAEPGELYVDRVKRDYIVVEPNIAPKYTGPNKDWGWENWVSLSKQLSGELVQLGPVGTRTLKRARHIVTPRFRDALKALAGAKLLITTDGALHHAAAALGIPAVVIWGGVASPRNLGYDSHTNLWSENEPCGTFWSECGHCREALAQIKVSDVLEAADERQRVEA